MERDDDYQDEENDFQEDIPLNQLDDTIDQTESAIREQNALLDAQFGYEEFKEGDSKVGWLLNIVATSIEQEGSPAEAGVELFFIEQSGDVFKGTFMYRPYFYVFAKEGKERAVMTYIERVYRDYIASVEIERKLDMDKPNHLVAEWSQYIKIIFHNVQDLMRVRKEIMNAIDKNKNTKQPIDTEEEIVHAPASSYMIDIREYDVPYICRVCIDNNIRIGSWFEVTPEHGHILVKRLEDMVATSDPKIFAFDIECSKEPLKFPNAENDSIYMISIMINSQGYLIINREFVSQDIQDFSYTPKPDYPGPFIVFNELNEEGLLYRFYSLIKSEKPQIFVTFNGDFFDWPFVRDRSKHYNIDMEREIGIRDVQGEFRGRCAVHLDAFAWVNRDSYLPQGSRGLKAVTKYKLGYDPIEIPAEEMQKQAMENPFYMASYSVSDAVATYYLYKKYVHLFIYSLCTIIPLVAEDVLRKGSGTLCETLLMVEAYKEHIIFPNKVMEDPLRFYNGHLLETETYIGGTVECLESGVYRNDLETDFNLDPTAYTELINKIDEQLNFTIEVENGYKRHDVVNYDEVRQQIIYGLEALRDRPKRQERPVIYHLDVGAMYPNIILTNRLEPCSVVNRDICSSCSYNKESNLCKRVLEWRWRGDYYPLTNGEYKHIRNQLEQDFRVQGKEIRTGNAKDEFVVTLKNRIKDYCRKGYKRVKDTSNEIREATTCMREHPFYVNTVKDFRDRRYDKLMDAQMRSLLYDSLQLAHKCILNSFYGYVMRKGARWRSIQMAGIVTNVGGGIITNARKMVERVGRPLELDTDGIWCILPESFPQTFKFYTQDGQSFPVIYPCIMLNYIVHNNNTNHQYQNYNQERHTFTIQSECSIFFELDGPYKAMVLPASTEEGKLLKKRYAVFNFDGSIAELKGFEMKRRGELQIIKEFQSQVFEKFLEGDTLKDCYDHVAAIANRWLDVLFTHGSTIEDEELIELISENKTMSRAIEDYGTQKSASITTVKRLAEFLGEDMLMSSGVSCSMVVSKYPEGAPVTERVIPTNIFQTEEKIKRHFLREWSKNNSLTDTNIRNILDWNYYIDRFSKTVQKIITIPAGLQNIPNPVPRVPHPDWVRRMANRKLDPFKQTKIDDLFTPQMNVDIEDIIPENIHGEDSEEISVVQHPIQIAVDLVLTNKNKNLKRSEDLQGWLAARKETWRASRKRIIPTGKKSKKNSIPKVISSNMNSSSYWQVVELSETSIPGELSAWVILDKEQLINLRIMVPRNLYITANKPLKMDNITAVTRILPGEQSYNYLYHLEANEKEFNKNIEDLWTQNIYSSLANIYGTKCPSAFTAVMNIGCVCSVRQDMNPSLLSNQKIGLSNIYKTIEKKYKLNQINMLNTVNNDYLTYYRRFFIYINIQDNNRGLIGVYMNTLGNEDIEINARTFPASSASLQVIELNAFSNPSDDHMPYKRLLKEAFNEQVASHTTVKVIGTKSLDETYNALNSILVDYNSRPHPPTFLHIQTSFSPKNIRALCPILEEFPLICYDLNYSEISVRELSWRVKLSECFVNNIYTSFVLWKDRLEGARYSHIPVGNLQTDLAVYMSDVLYSRLLTVNKHVLWVSPTSLPDFGGKEEDIEITLGREESSPAVNNPNNYKSICYDIKIYNLCIDAIKQYEFLDKEESIYTQEEDGCQSAFSVLRLYITKCLNAVSTSQNKYADYILLNIYRWLRSSTSFSFNPYIVKLLSRLMNHIFKALLNEFRRLDVTVIYANYEHIYICTKKYTIDDAEEYITYILDTIREKELFKYIQFAKVRQYSQLLWLDNTNFSGFLTWQNEELTGESMQSDTAMYISNYMLAELLPEDYKKMFLGIIAEYINKQQTFRNEKINEGRGAENIQELENKYIFEYIRGELLPSLLQCVSKLQVAIPTNDSTLIPHTVNVLSEHNNPLLDFVKYLCELLQLDSDFEPLHLSLKRQLLKNIHVREFSPEAQYMNPLSSLVIPAVICTLCNDYRDIDICRDSDAKNEPWVCNNCGNEYNMRYIESRLVEQVNDLLYTFNNQDLCCMKCDRIKTDSLSIYCSCSGNYIYKDISVETLKKKLQIYSNVAKYHEFNWLKETVDQYLNL
ncbi:hypothetical protein WA158_000761 [Blastocystis sp. Blastoise]